SGALLPTARTTSGADVLLVHGAADDVLPVEGMYGAVAELAPLGARVRYHVRPRLGHSIDQEGIALGADFLRRQFLG
ncbi:MAG: phospholipase, partial [Rhodospirillales bacterium]|nr:phospholipase [Rhodospirillales bacterium]